MKAVRRPVMLQSPPIHPHACHACMPCSELHSDVLPQSFPRSYADAGPPEWRAIAAGEMIVRFSEDYCYEGGRGE